MVDYSPDETVDMIMILAECNGVYVSAAARYAVSFPNTRHPSNIIIGDLTTELDMIAFLVNVVITNTMKMSFAF